MSLSAVPSKQGGSLQAAPASQYQYLLRPGNPLTSTGNIRTQESRTGAVEEAGTLRFRGAGLVAGEELGSAHA